MAELSSNFELLWTEIHMYLNPELMKKKIDLKGTNRRNLKSYSDRLQILNQAFTKIKRYPLYFSEFYPSTKEISPEEALEYHMHAYLTDLTILKLAIIALLDDLQTDVLATTRDKKKAYSFFKQCKEVTEKRFENVAKHRNPHDHARSRFLDEDNVRSSLLKTIVKVSSTFPDMIKEGGVALLQNKAEAFFQKGKATRLKIAQDNAEGLTKLMDALFMSLEDCLYKFLAIKPIIRGPLVEAMKKKTAPKRR